MKVTFTVDLDDEQAEALAFMQEDGFRLPASAEAKAWLQDAIQSKVDDSLRIARDRKRIDTLMAPPEVSFTGPVGGEWYYVDFEGEQDHGTVHAVERVFLAPGVVIGTDGDYPSIGEMARRSLLSRGWRSVNGLRILEGFVPPGMPVPVVPVEEPLGPEEPVPVEEPPPAPAED